MTMDLQNELKLLDHSQEKRKTFCLLLQHNTSSVSEILFFAEQFNDPISYRALWGLEFMCRESLSGLLPYIDRFIRILPKVHLHAGVRRAAKICEHIIIKHYRHKQIYGLSLKNREAIASACFDWLITDQKVAPKAYSMTCLLYLGKEFKWIHPELKILLENNYVNQSAAYKARARFILSKI